LGFVTQLETRMESRLGEVPADNSGIVRRDLSQSAHASRREVTNPVALELEVPSVELKG
jgi:hypothetical protein